MANFSAAKSRIETRTSRSRSLSPSRSSSRSRSRSRTKSPLDTERAVPRSSSELSNSDSATGSDCSAPTRKRLSGIEDVAELGLDSLSISLSVSPQFPPSRQKQSATPSPNSLHPPPLRVKRKQVSPTLPRTLSPMNLRPVRLLIASLGNPSPYQSTRHSAAHILLKAFASHLNFSPLVKNKQYGGGSISSGADAGRPEYTLWQSASQMNISGAGTIKAWKEFVSQHKTSDAVTGLVVLHDELETAPAQFKLRRGDGSARGHRGIKSVQENLKGQKLMAGLGERYVKIGIGIGRPVSRESDAVSAFVLGQVTQRERQGIEGKVEELDGLLRQEIERMGRQ